MANILIKSAEYNGKYVAMKDFGNTEVVGSGKTPNEAHEEAMRHGYKEPVIVFVPTKDMVYIY